MAIDHQHQQDTDQHQHAERQKDKNAYTLLLLAVVTCVVVAIIAAVVLLNREPPPLAPQPTSTAAQRAADEAAALETVEQYNIAVGEAYASKQIGPELKDLASYNRIQDTQEYIESMVLAGETRTGGSKIVEAEVTNWEKATTGFDRVMTVQVCADISGVALVDATGAPVPALNSDGSPMTRTRLPVEYFIQSRPDGSYFVTGTRPDPDVTATC